MGPERVSTMSNKTCGTCIDNDCGLCDRLGIWVEDDDDACEDWNGATSPWQDAMLRTFLAGH